MKKRDYVKQVFYDSTGISTTKDIEIVLKDEDILSISAFLSGEKINNDPYNPKIDIIFESYLLELKKLMAEENIPVFIKKKWPFGKEFAVAITHDADRISVDIEHFNRVKDRFTEEVIQAFFQKNEDPYWNIEKIAKMEKEFGFRSSFYLLLSEYQIDSKLETFTRLRDEGWEIGLHGGFNTHNNTNELLKELELFRNCFGNKSEGIREHYLKFDPGKTWDIMNELQLKYDTTWGFNKNPGFKASISLPFNPPNSEWECFNILEIPLVLMDTSLWGYMNLDEKQGLELIREMMNVIKNTGGLFTILWHQEALLMKKGRIYIEILKILANEECFVGSALSICEWWMSRKNATAKMKKHGNKWIYSIRNAPKSMVIEVYHKNVENLKIEGKGTINKKTNRIVEVEVMGECDIIVKE